MNKKILLAVSIILIMFTALPSFAIDNATAKLENMSNANTSINMSDYAINQMISTDENETAFNNVRNVITAPVRFAASADFAGYWFYCFIIFVVLIYVYGKSKSIEITSLIMMLMSLMVIVPAMTTGLVVPNGFLVLMYVMSLLGLVGIFYGTSDR